MQPVSVASFTLFRHVMFQYRKRYGPVATGRSSLKELADRSMFQYRKRYYPVATVDLKAEFHIRVGFEFQYRKR